MLFAEGMPSPSERASLEEVNRALNEYWETLKPWPTVGPDRLDYEMESGFYPFRTLVITGKSAWQAAAALIVEIERRVQPGDRIRYLSAPKVSHERDPAADGDVWTAKVRFAIIAERYRRS